MWKKAEKFLLKDKYIGPLIKKYGSCTIKPSKPSDYFLDLVDSICSQQLSAKAAATIFGRVKNGVGEITPGNILKTKDGKFRSWGLSRQKTSYIKDLSKKVTSGGVQIGKLKTLSDDEVIRELVSVKGIGIWTAKMFLMFSLARPDVFPEEDLGIRKGISQLLNKLVKLEKIGQFATRWKPYRSAASWYIWKSLDNKE